MTGIRVVRAEGDAYQRGRQIGRGLGELIENSLKFYNHYLKRRGVTSSQLQDFLTPYLAAAETNLPALTETIHGMSEGAMVPVWELFAVNMFEELEPLLEPDERRLSFLQRDVGYGMPKQDHCSSFVVSGPGYTLLGHNEQWLAGDMGNVAVVCEYPTGGAPAIASPSVVCCLPAVGMNEFGGAQAIQSLIAADDGVGVPRVLVSRHSLESADRMEAVRRAGLDSRAGGYGHVFAFSGGDAFIVETSGRRTSLLEGPGPHTNHYLDPQLAELGPEPSPGSVGRYERLLELIEERSPETPEGVMGILRDHEAIPQPICLHPDPDAGDESAAVVFSMVCDVEGGRMWVAAGPPCTSPYEEIDLAGVR